MSQKKGFSALAMAGAVGAQAAMRKLTGKRGNPRVPGAKRKQANQSNNLIITRKASLPSSVNPIGSNVLGSYAPAAMSTQVRPTGPRTISSGRNGKRIVHRELVGSVVGSSAFTVQNSIYLNPGLSAFAPWLASQAAFWEQYTFHRIRFEYLTRCGSSQAGSVIMAPDYDAFDVNPVTEANLSTYQDSVEDAPWKNIVTELDPKAMHPSGPRKFIRQGPVVGDIKTYDAGVFFLATADCGGTPAIGKLWVEYDVELFVPTSSPTNISAAQQTTQYLRAANQTLTSTVVTALVFDTLITDGLRLNVTLPSGAIVPPAGTYRLHARCSANDNANEAFSGQLLIAKNGSTIAATSGAYNYPAPGGANSQMHFNIFHVVTVNGTDTIGVALALTGAAGTLTANGNSISLMIEVA